VFKVYVAEHIAHGMCLPFEAVCAAASLIEDEEWQEAASSATGHLAEPRAKLFMFNRHSLYFRGHGDIVRKAELSSGLATAFYRVERSDLKAFETAMDRAWCLASVSVWSCIEAFRPLLKDADAN
jgi:hypothetical protein